MKKWALAATLGLGLGIALAAAPTNTYVRMILDTIPDFDPTQAYDTASNEVVLNVYEPLITYKNSGVKDLEPLLASAMPKVTNGGKTYTVSLRKGVKFQSGNPFTCADAEYTFRRALVVSPSDSWPATIFGLVLLNSPSNAKDDPSITWAKISKAVSCNSNGQLVFNLVKPDAAFMTKLAFTGAGIIDKKFAVAGGEWDGTEKTWKSWAGKSLHDSYLTDHMSGTGAYQLVSKSPSEYVFKAFAGYWGDKPKLQNVVLRVVPEESTRLLAVQKGDADFVDLVNRPALAQLQGSKDVTIIDGVDAMSVDVIFMNQNIRSSANIGSGKLDGKGIPANFFSDINVRKGFAYAFDYQKYVKQVLEGKGKVLTMALPDTFLGYDPSIKAPTYSLEKATAYLKKAWGGKVWQNGFTVDVWFNAGNNRRQIAGEMLKAGLEAINPKFKLNVVSRPFADVIQNGESGVLAMSIGGWSPDYPDPDDYMPIFYSSTGMYHFRTGLKDASIDKALDQAAQIANPAKRESLYKLVGKRGNDLTPFIIVPERVEFRVISKNLKGYTVNPVLAASDTFWKNLSK
ncbi:MAG TPA: ABC transporter substrate-binding protein [Deinococcales bacterium]|nr:ABC transporter substrate-binding protein [Deinococcales bacterium]